MRDIDWNPIHEWIGSAIDNGGEFAMRESPLVAQEIVAWEIWSNVTIAGTLFSVAAAISCTLLLCRKSIISGIQGRDEIHSAGSVMSCVLGVLIVVMSLTHGVIATAKIAKAIVAPRILLIEKSTEFAK